MVLSGNVFVSQRKKLLTEKKYSCFKNQFRINYLCLCCKPDFKLLI